VELVELSGTKRGNVGKEVLMSLKQSVRKNISEIYLDI
jgi:hypothetical protein